jgi:L-aspartate oxidase
MWKHVGVRRDGTRLDDACEMFDFWGRYTLDKIFDTPEGWEVQNMLIAGAVIANAAAWRAESRGTHRRTDHPQPLDAFRLHDHWRRGRAQPMTTRPIDAHPAPTADTAPEPTAAASVPDTR